VSHLHEPQSDLTAARKVREPAQASAVSAPAKIDVIYFDHAPQLF
jgi:hypothetical protein